MIIPIKVQVVSTYKVQSGLNAPTQAAHTPTHLQWSIKVLKTCIYFCSTSNVCVTVSWLYRFTFGFTTSHWGCVLFFLCCRNVFKFNNFFMSYWLAAFVCLLWVSGTRLEEQGKKITFRKHEISPKASHVLQLTSQKANTHARTHQHTQMWRKRIRAPWVKRENEIEQTEDLLLWVMCFVCVVCELNTV